MSYDPRLCRLPGVLVLACTLAGSHVPSTDDPHLVGDRRRPRRVGRAGGRRDRARRSGADCRAETGVDGAFSLDCAKPGDRLTVEAAGLRAALVVASEGPTRVTLDTASFAEAIVVTATRGDRRTTSPAAPVSILTASDLALAPPTPLDDVLKVVPGFSLFRRTTSRSANPTTQGAGLRGLSASGASRALVLADGEVLNDPFGGWVYWDRVPAAAIDRVEVVRGGASDLYGADALVGVRAGRDPPADLSGAAGGRLGCLARLRAAVAVWRRQSRRMDGVGGGRARDDRRLHPGWRGRPRRRRHPGRRRIRRGAGRHRLSSRARRLPRALAATCSTSGAKTARRCRPTAPTWVSFVPPWKGRWAARAGA